jgi:hypothetical protein
MKVSSDQAALAALNYKLAVDNAQRATTEAETQQNWKRAEYLANQVQLFFADEIVERIIYALD